MIPIAIIWFGIDEASKYFFIGYGVFFTTLINTIAGVRHTPLVRKRAAMSLGAGTGSLFFRITLPSAMPFINTGMRVALGGAFMSVIAAEMIAAITGREPLLTLDGLRMSRQRMFFSSEKAARELGFRSRPYAEGLRDAVDWFRAAGYLR